MFQALPEASHIMHAKRNRSRRGSSRLGRRQFLRAGAAVIALPALEAFARPAARAVRPRNFVAVGTYLGWHQPAFIPAQAGCDYPVVRSKEDFVAKVRDVTDGEGAAVVYEAIGKDTLQQSLDCLRLMGVCAAYGHVSGPPDPIDIIQDLGRRGSLFTTRPAIMHYVAKRSDLEWTAKDLF